MNLDTFRDLVLRVHRHPQHVLGRLMGYIRIQKPDRIELYEVSLLPSGMYLVLAVYWTPSTGQVWRNDSGTALVNEFSEAFTRGN